MMLPRRTLLNAALALPALALLPRPARADAKEYFQRRGIAASGYDPVAYFHDGRPVAGAAAHAVMWRGALWHFASPDTMTEFEMNPTAYAPQYGGYCAYAMAQGALASSDPAAFTIHEGRLYLNYSLDVRAEWQKDIPGYIARADRNWPGILRG